MCGSKRNHNFIAEINQFALKLTLNLKWSNFEIFFIVDSNHSKKEKIKQF